MSMIPSASRLQGVIDSYFLREVERTGSVSMDLYLTITEEVTEMADTTLSTFALTHGLAESTIDTPHFLL